MSDTSPTTPPGTSQTGNYLTAQDRPRLYQYPGDIATEVYVIDPRAHFSLGFPPYPWERSHLEQYDELGDSQTSEESSMSSSLRKDDIRNQAKYKKVGLGKKLKRMFEKFFFKRESVPHKQKTWI